MFIAIDIRSLLESERTGVGEYTFELLDALFELDRTNQYFLFYNSFRDISANLPHWKQDNITMLRFKLPNKLFNLLLLFLHWPKLDKLILKKIKKQTGRKLKLDYWFAPNINFLALSQDVKLILTIHDLSFLYFSDCFGWKRRLWHKLVNPRRICKKADIVLVPSANTARDVERAYDLGAEKIKVIYPGLSSIFDTLEVAERDIERVVAKYNLSDKFILFLGTIEPRKNIIGLIEAFMSSGLGEDGYQLIIAGSQGWGFEPIIKLVAQNDRIKYIGYVEAKDKPALYKLSALFAYPSLYEGFGFPVLEAMAMGTPILTSNRSSLSEVAGGCGYLANPNNIYDIAQGMRSILKDNPELNVKYGEWGRQYAKKFNWRESTRQFLNNL